MKTSLSLSESTLKWGSKELFGTKKDNNTLEVEATSSKKKSLSKKK